ncbi:hypothetical protein ACWIUD_06740 [Helicobacter sp. 23-1044]
MNFHKITLKIFKIFRLFQSLNQKLKLDSAFVESNIDCHEVAQSATSRNDENFRFTPICN